MKTRNKDLDAIRGVAIILVVIGHCIQAIWQNNCDNNILFRIIYSFHMPLFMFVSGVAATYAIDITCFKWIRKRFIGLVIPFLSWIIIFYIVENQWKEKNIINRVMEVLLHPDSGYWFLWVLFLNSIILYLVNKINGKLRYIVYGMIIVFAIYCHIVGSSFDYFGIGLCLWHITFFLGGFIIKKYFSYPQLYKKRIFILCFLIFLVLAIFWNRMGDPLFLSSLEEQMVWGMIPEIIRKILIKIVYTYAVPIAGIISICMLIKCIKGERIKQSLAVVGRYTLEIYVLHGFLIKIIQTNNIFLNVILNTIFALVLSILIAGVLERNKVIGYALFGKCTRKQITMNKE